MFWPPFLSAVRSPSWQVPWFWPICSRSCVLTSLPVCSVFPDPDITSCLSVVCLGLVSHCFLLPCVVLSPLGGRGAGPGVCPASSFWAQHPTGGCAGLVWVPTPFGVPGGMSQLLAHCFPVTWRAFWGDVGLSVSWYHFLEISSSLLSCSFLFKFYVLFLAVLGFHCCAGAF